MFDILAAEVIKQCDPQNGLSEDIISDPRGCNFNAKTLACNMPSAAEECITADQLSTLHKLYNDWTDVNQTFVYGHLTIEQQYWYVRDLMGLEDSFTWQNLDYSTVQLAEKLNPGNATADTFDISDFHKRGFNITACQMPLSFHPDNMTPPSTLGYRDSRHDIALAMMAWAENGTAPNEHAATNWKNSASVQFATAFTRQSIVARATRTTRGS
ncbi:hypothetical protein PENARI_c012G12459 [Penicillium arizonense]|uniref:Carboxylic ester hydrolase n=1 Tax=Penicillium arizonense TaxID=1835702 RepID=A0A1F5LFD2_PENAI|nr:hypothetical protein PENARI_c012G12459 [Penicillium arizonense]OGE51902.1 hypothetical protein PENARI_c012G12459 [Penicillium arizonense]